LFFSCFFDDCFGVSVSAPSPPLHSPFSFYTPPWVPLPMHTTPSISIHSRVWCLLSFSKEPPFLLPFDFFLPFFFPTSKRLGQTTPRSDLAYPPIQ
jgi:hypothetical protein